MLFTTPTQWLALAVALIAGWLFGLASHPGGRKWKQRYADERDVHGRNRKDYDARLAERDARIKELERENARLAKAAPVAAPVTTHAPVAAHAPIAQTAARPAGTMRARWFDWQNRVGTNG
ncbi:hypothetical protein [Sphingomonas jeddahensis]|uniref:Uncharacterized protein n=1 Tax=Sphingomonas jeddahensis TaxID=1915074 RepID=A0A1V2EUV9_9SPHN|nr:hypothetical protein [Sphingomonas jeddahensis]ONF96255.1 hypothetical protein SPHI_14840 [Sphingomonas jeddahensis]